MDSSVVVGGVRVKLSDVMLMYLGVRAKMVEAALGAARLAIEAALVDEVNLRVGRARYEWRFLSQATKDDWHCPRCGSNRAADFSRDGKYCRSLSLALGQIRNLLVPRLECQGCGASIATNFAVIAKYKRFWYDLNETALMEYGLSVSLRRIAAKLANALGSVSLCTLTSRIHEIERGINEWKSRAIEDVPDVLQLDGIWFRRMVPTGKKKRDSRGRLRSTKRCADRVVLVAAGIWSGSCRREILDWHTADSEWEQVTGVSASSEPAL